MAYTFNLSNGSLMATLDNPGDGVYDDFGASVAISGSTVVVGADGTTVGGLSTGAAYVFDATNGSLLHTLNKPDNPQNSDRFGESVSVSGTVAVVGATSADVGGINHVGAAYAFNTTTGNLIATLSHPSPTMNDSFGISVSVSGTVAAVGTPDERPNGVWGEGVIYIFDVTDGTLLDTVFNPVPDQHDYFGESVAIDGSTVVGGSWNKDLDGMLTVGAAYAMDLCGGGGGGGGGTTACSAAGEMYYDSTLNNIVWCDGSILKTTASGNGAGGAGCSTPTASAGAMNYSGSAYSFCDGASWVSIP